MWDTCPGLWANPEPACPHCPPQPVQHCCCSLALSRRCHRRVTHTKTAGSGHLPLKKKASPLIWATASKWVLHLFGTSRLTLQRDAQVSMTPVGSKGPCPPGWPPSQWPHPPCPQDPSRRPQAAFICHSLHSNPAMLHWHFHNELGQPSAWRQLCGRHAPGPLETTAGSQVRTRSTSTS